MYFTNSILSLAIFSFPVFTFPFPFPEGLPSSSASVEVIKTPYKNQSTAMEFIPSGNNINLGCSSNLDENTLQDGAAYIESN